HRSARSRRCIQVRGAGTVGGVDDEATAGEPSPGEPSPDVLWLATTRPDGRPHLTPIWFRYVEGRFWLCATPDAVKVRNLAARPDCSVALDGIGRPRVAEGHARLHDRAGGPFPPA